MGIQNLSGQTLGQYELQGLLGTGGMGSVYRAYQAALKRTVAVKVIGTDKANKTDYVERFTREAQTAAALEHAHIVPVYDYGTQGDINYIVMRLLTGGSLSDRMERAQSENTPIPLAEVSRLLTQLGGALDYAHQRGVIHRDIKPGNIMFDSSGTAYLVDFGIAKLSSGAQLTTTGMTVGTPAYMPPEQWRAELVTSASDQYALGAVIFSVLAGRLPFEAPTPYALMHKHVTEPLTPLTALRPDLPEAISGVLGRAMAKNADDRFPSVGDFATTFAEATTGKIAPPAPDTNRLSATPNSIPAPRPASGNAQTVLPATTVQSGRPMRLIGAVAALVVIGGLAALGITAVQQQNSANANLTAVALNGTQTRQAVSPTLPPTLTITSSVTIAPTLTITSSATIAPTLTPIPPSATISASLTSAPTRTRTQQPAAAAVQVTAFITIAPASNKPRKLVFASSRDAENALFAVNTSGEPNQRQLGTDTFIRPGATYSPDGQQIAYISYRNGTDSLVIASANGGDPKEITKAEPGHFWANVRWARQTIIYQEYDTLYLYNQATGDTKVMDITGLDSYAIRHDSNQMVYSASKDGKQYLAVYNLETEQTRLITGGQSDDVQPNLSPNGKQVVFRSDREGGGIFTLALDGTDYFKLAGGQPYDAYPEWSPDGNRIAFMGYDNEGGRQVFVMNANGQNRTLLSSPTRAGKSLIGGLAWSPDGKTLLFRSGDENREIYSMDAEGRAPTRLTTSPDYDSSPSLSPDGSLVAYTKNGLIAVMNLDGSNARMVGAVAGSDPAWSPNGKQLVFAALNEKGNGRSLAVINLDGTGLRQLGNPDVFDYWPSFSPDGQRITFFRYEDGRGQIFVVNADGSNLKNLTPPGEYHEWPSWSPDGKQIAYLNRSDTAPGIWTMNADGSNAVRSVRVEYPLANLSWHDGYFLFTTEENGSEDLYRVTLDDTKTVTRLTNSPAPDTVGHS